MGHTKTSRKESGVQKNIDHDGPAQKVSEEKNISKWPRDHCDSLVKNVDEFCLGLQAHMKMVFATLYIRLFPTFIVSLTPVSP